MIRTLAAALLLGACACAGAQDAVKRFYGYAYHLDGGSHAFTEVQEHRVAAGQWVSGSTRYYLPDGRAIGHKTLDFRADPFVPVFRLELSDGYAEGVSAGAGPVELFRGAAGAPERAAVPREGPMAADAGLPRLLRAEFPMLLAGETLKFRIAAPSRLAAYKFKARRVADVLFERQPAVRIQVDMDSMLKMFTGPLYFTYEPETLRLLEFSGLTNVRDPASGEAFNVRIAYYSSPPPGLPGALPPLSPPEK